MGCDLHAKDMQRTLGDVRSWALQPEGEPGGPTFTGVREREGQTTHSHTHTCTHIHAHTSMCTHMYTHVHTFICTGMPSPTHIQIHTHGYTHKHMCTHMYMHIYTHSYAQACPHPRTCRYTHVHMHTSIELIPLPWMLLSPVRGQDFSPLTLRQPLSVQGGRSSGSPAPLETMPTPWGRGLRAERGRFPLRC